MLSDVEINEIKRHVSALVKFLAEQEMKAGNTCKHLYLNSKSCCIVCGTQMIPTI